MNVMTRMQMTVIRMRSVQIQMMRTRANANLAISTAGRIRQNREGTVSVSLLSYGRFL